MNHLICDGICQNYTQWIWHGEVVATPSVSHRESGSVDIDDRLEDMMRDIGEDSFKRAHVYETLCSDKDEPLYPGCTNFTRLSAVLKLFNLKAKNGWTDKSFTELLELLIQMLPEGNVMPNRYYEAKKVLCPMGLEYEKIHACPNDCILYRKEFVNYNHCPTCKASRYKKKDGDSSDDEVTKTGPPAKVVWYLPIISRFKRLFANANDAKNLRWHAEERKCDGQIRHVADSLQWKKIDSLFPNFGKESRNLRLGLATDGMNPFGNQSTNHSSWPVLLMIYNLSPWLCMKRKYIMLSMMISGPRQPGNDIDVYLSPLIDDLKVLWEEGVDVFDSYSGEQFNMRAMLFCTINDFPAYGNLSGYSVKGHNACPICEKKTCYKQLKNGKKTVYLGHRKFLNRYHPYRRLRKAFDGDQENGVAPTPLTGEEVYERQRDINVVFGKCQKPKGRVPKAKVPKAESESGDELVISFSLSLGSRSGDGIGILARMCILTVLDCLFWTILGWFYEGIGIRIGIFVMELVFYEGLVMEFYDAVAEKHSLTAHELFDGNDLATFLSNLHQDVGNLKAIVVWLLVASATDF
ncbi:unnamed protein product [Trifolium pratense]|uniref:Uncharacterized protein n=1 Tax=Trifolium pratense TaxID=57577 RepID=A0ACB0JBN1_TRIPR|nr:unnamed protein product [Trifolium pratense]